MSFFGMLRVWRMCFGCRGLKAVMQNGAQDFKTSEKIGGRRNCAHYTKSKYTGEAVEDTMISKSDDKSAILKYAKIQIGKSDTFRLIQRPNRRERKRRFQDLSAQTPPTIIAPKTEVARICYPFLLPIELPERSE